MILQKGLVRTHLPEYFLIYTFLAENASEKFPIGPFKTLVQIR